MAEVEDMQEDKDRNVIDWFFVGLRRWKIFTAVFFVVLSLATYYGYNKSMKEKPVYKSFTRIMMGPATLEVKTQAGDTIKRTYTIDDEITVLQSESVLNAAAGLLRTKYGYDKQQLAGVDVRSGSQGLVEISVTADSPQQAFDSVSAVIEAYQLQKAHEEKTFFDNAFITFQDQIDRAHSALLDAENELADFIVENEETIKIVERYDLLSGIDDNVIVSSMLNEKIIKLRDEILVLSRFIYSVAELSKSDNLRAIAVIARKYPDLIDVDLRNGLVEKEAELNKTLQMNEEAHPEVIRLRGEMQNINEKIDKDILKVIIELKTNMEELVVQEKELSNLAQENFYKKLIKYSMIKQDIILKRDSYNDLSKTMYQIDLGEKLKHYAEIRVVLPHKVPHSPKKADFKKNILAAFFISLICGGVVVYIMEILDTSIKGIEQLEKLIDLPVLATIPLYAPRKYTGDVNDSGTKNKLIVYSDPSSPASEAIRCFRTNILFLNPGKSIKVIGLTSSIPREGKSFIVANAAALTAQSNKKTLLIDCDLRRHGASEIFGMQNEKGLSDLLSEEESLLPENITFLDSGIDNLSIMPAGSVSDNPAERLGSPSMDRIISIARQAFDIIYVDLPPVLAVTDPLIIAQKVDALVFVVSVHIASKKSVERAYSIIKKSNIKLMGTILNKVDAGAGGYLRYRYKYGDHYGYYGKNIR